MSFFIATNVFASLNDVQSPSFLSDLENVPTVPLRKPYRSVSPSPLLASLNKLEESSSPQDQEQAACAVAASHILGTKRKSPEAFTGISPDLIRRAIASKTKPMPCAIDPSESDTDSTKKINDESNSSSPAAATCAPQRLFCPHNGCIFSSLSSIGLKIHQGKVHRDNKKKQAMNKNLCPKRRKLRQSSLVGEKEASEKPKAKQYYYQCLIDKCSQKFDDQSSLDAHQSKHHPSSMQEEPIASQTCSNCELLKKELAKMKLVISTLLK